MTYVTLAAQHAARLKLYCERARRGLDLWTGLPVVRRCAVCCRPFLPRHPFHRYCSPRCNTLGQQARRTIAQQVKVARREQRRMEQRRLEARARALVLAQRGERPADCPQCGTRFTLQPRERPRIYCTPACQERADQQRRRVPQQQGDCERCGTPFTGRAGQRFCTKQCGARHRQIQLQEATP